MASKQSLESSLTNMRAKSKRGMFAIAAVGGVLLGAGIGGKVLADVPIPKTKLPVNYAAAGLGVVLALWGAVRNKPMVFGVGCTMVGMGAGQVFLGAAKNPLKLGGK